VWAQKLFPGVRFLGFLGPGWWTAKVGVHKLKQGLPMRVGRNTGPSRLFSCGGVRFGGGRQRWTIKRGRAKTEALSKGIADGVT